MNILLIGGSYFVGPLIIEKLLKSGHGVTVFNRGRVRTSYPAGVKFIKGDRNNGFGMAEKFDAVIDACAYYGYQTERALRDLKFDFFVHLSTAAVYRKTETFPLIEDSPLGDWPLWGDYNIGKRECEKVLEEGGAPFAVLRPVYILGPRNYLNRELFVYSRLKKDLPIVLPGNGQALVQFVSAKDVADSVTLLVEKKLRGPFNAAGDAVITLKGLIEEMAKIVGMEPRIEFNPLTDGEKFNSLEFPFANENFVCSNEKIKKAGMSFIALVPMLERDYEEYYGRTD